MQKTRRSELLYFLAVPSIATIGGFFTTAEDGFPFIFYAMYLPLLVISKSLEVFLLRRWQQVDLTSAEIQTQQWESMGFGHPIALLCLGYWRPQGCSPQKDLMTKGYVLKASTD